VTSRASALAWLLAGCGAEPVEARAIWVDDHGGEGRRRIHVYNRGQLEQFEVLGENDPIERVELAPHGRGLLIRTGDRRGAWFDLEDGRRLPLLLPSTDAIEFADDALIWVDPYLDSAVVVVPLAPGLALARAEDGTVEPLTRGAALQWTVTAAQAPIVFAASPDPLGGGSMDGRASFFRYPTRAGQPLALALEAEAQGLAVLPDAPKVERQCGLNGSACYSKISVEPEGELAIFSYEEEGPWELFERRSPDLAGALELPPSLDEKRPGLRLLQVLDRAVSIWVSPSQLHRYDRVRGTVDSLPMVGVEELHWNPAERGRAVILNSSSGPVYRADLAGLRAVSLESTDCPGPGAPVVSPSGRFVAWTCAELDAIAERPPTTSINNTVVRVSELGLERYVGVSMQVLALDDDGDLLLYSVETTYDGLEDIGGTSIPHNLFVLSSTGVLTRIDELEPAPAPAIEANGVATYMQGAALVGEQ
jgi:hypothetical protein